METRDSDIRKTEEFFEKAYPEPTDKNFHTQLGVHFEEIAEMLDALTPLNAQAGVFLGLVREITTSFSGFLKTTPGSFEINDRVEFLDGLCDQIVTATGTGHMAGMLMSGAMGEVNRSNASKFGENGEPILDENRKMMKGPHYKKPNLESFV